MKLKFLQAVSQISTVKEIEMVILDQLMHDLTADELNDRLKELELAALRMMLNKPTTPTLRHRLCFRLLDYYSPDITSNEAFGDIITTQDRSLRPKGPGNKDCYGYFGTSQRSSTLRTVSIINA